MAQFGDVRGYQFSTDEQGLLLRKYIMDGAQPLVLQLLLQPHVLYTVHYHAIAAHAGGSRLHDAM